MDNILEKLQHVTEARRQLLLEHAFLLDTLEELQASQLVSLNQHLARAHLLDGGSPVKIQGPNQSPRDYSVENLRAKLWEVEKRYSLQQLKYEELLLELEDIRKKKPHSDSTGAISDSKSDPIFRLSSSHSMGRGFFSQTSRSTEMDASQHSRGMHQTMRTKAPITQANFDLPLQDQFIGCTFSKSASSIPESNDDRNPDLELLQTSDNCVEMNDIPAPRMIKLERQLTHSVLISWKPPKIGASSQTVSAYHVYVDGQFRLAVRAREKTRALLDNVNVDKPHRISVRAICSKGQSKDAECTLVVGRGTTVTPGRLRATHIGPNSARLSWMPGNSNLCHRVFLNQMELKTCPPGIYKVLLTDLPPDTLHRVCVQAIQQRSGEAVPQPVNLLNITGIQSGVDVHSAAAFIEFRTIPIGMPDPPTNVQLEAGPQDGMLLVTWQPVQQDENAAVAAVISGGGSQLPVQGYTVCLNEKTLTEVNGAFNDHAVIPLKLIKHHLEAIICNADDHSTSNSAFQGGASPVDCSLHASAFEQAKQCLFITVHSIVSSSSSAEPVDKLPEKECLDSVKGGSPASLPVLLTPELLISAAGSLEGAIRLFGSKLATRIGLDETASKRSGVPRSSEADLDTDHVVYTEADGVIPNEPGLIAISASTSEKKISPMSEAICSAEALLMRRELEKNEYSNKTESLYITRNKALEATTKERDRTAASSVRIPNFHRRSGEHFAQNWSLPSNVHQRYVLRKEWGKSRSISDEYEPRFRVIPHEDSVRWFDRQNDSPSSTDPQSSDHCIFRASSLHNLNSRASKSHLRLPGGSSSSWDLRNPTSNYIRMHKRRNPYKMFRRKQHTMLPQWAQTDQPYCSGISPSYGSPRRSEVNYLKQRRFSPRFSLLTRYFSNSMHSPGPIISALSSSSNEDWHHYIAYNSNAVRGKKSDNNHMHFPLECDPVHKLPRSRSVSPLPLHTTRAEAHLAAAHFDSPSYPFDSFNSQAANFPAYQANWKCPSRRRIGRLSNEQRNMPTSEHRMQSGRSTMTTVPEIPTYATQAACESFRQHACSHLNDQINVTETACHNLAIPRSHMNREKEERMFEEDTHKLNMLRADDEMCHDYPISTVERDSLFSPPQDRNKKPIESMTTHQSDISLPTVRMQQGVQRLNVAGSKITRLTKDMNEPSMDTMRLNGKGKDVPLSEMNMRVVVALYTYDPATMSPNVDAVQEELPFQEGQIIKIFGECDPDGFYLGECNGLRGLVPSNMVTKPEEKAFHRSENKALTESRKRLDINALPPGQVMKPRNADRVYPRNIQMSALPDDQTDYVETKRQINPRLFNDVPECGQPQRVRMRQSKAQPVDDYRPTINGRPTREFDSSSTIRQPPARHPHPRQPVKSNESEWKQRMTLERRPMYAVYEYDPSILSPNADAEMELSFHTGDLITVYGGVDEDGFYYGESADGRRGLVPSNFLREYNESTAIQHRQPVRKGERGRLKTEQTKAGGFEDRYGGQDASSIEDNRQSRTGKTQNHCASSSTSSNATGDFR